jgi:Fe-S cluster biosynthesis and repair protein YggX
MSIYEHIRDKGLIKWKNHDNKITGIFVENKLTVKGDKNRTYISQAF